MAWTMLSSLTLQTPRKVARRATVIATWVVRRAVARSCDEVVDSSAALADSIGSRSIGGSSASSVRVQCSVSDRQTVEYHITHYDLEQGALEIQYIEEYFGEFPRKKTAAEIVRRLTGRAHLILLANAPLPDDPGSVVPVSFKVAHEIRLPETEPKLIDLVRRLHEDVQF